MRVEDLIKLLANCPPNALVIINGAMVEGIKELVGRAGGGYFDNQFRETSKGRDKAVTFTRACERSDGVIDQSSVW